MGIGTESPQTGLHLEGNNLPDATFRLNHENAANSPTIQFASGGDVTWTIGGNKAVFSVTSPSANRFLMTTDYTGFFESPVGIGGGFFLPDTQLHVFDNRSGNTISNHVTIIENGASTGADVLALKIARTANPTSGNNFISFYDGNDELVGQIDGNGSGGVNFKSSSADFAEMLPRLDLQEDIEAGDIVGVVAGKVTRETTNSDRIMVVSTAPIVLGNMPLESEEHGYEKVAFMGQVPVKVRGPVNSGDYIISSGLNDGTGVGVSPGEMTASDHALIVGQAWESSSDHGVKLINTVMGSPASLSPLLHQLTREMSQLKLENEELRQRLEALEALLTVRK